MACDEKTRSGSPPLPALSLAVFALLAVFVWFRPERAFMVDFFSDEAFYFGQLATLIGEPLPERAMNGAFVAPFTAIAWLLPALLGKAVAIVTDGDHTAWIWIAISVWSFAAWILGAVLTWKVLATFTRFAALPSVVQVGLFFAFFLNIPMIYYAVFRPLLAHSIEFPLALATVLALRQRRPAFATLLGTALTLTRFDDAPVFLMIAAGWLGSDLKARIAANRVVYAAGGAFAFVAIAWVSYLGLYAG